MSKITLLTYHFACLVAITSSQGPCQQVNTVTFPTTYAWCEQPLFQNFLPKTEENMLLDNVCLTAFPLPDDPYTYIFYIARVFCDGSHDVSTFVNKQLGDGKSINASPSATVSNQFIGYAGCETYVVYRCSIFGGSSTPAVFGITTECRPLALACLSKVDEIISDQCLPDQDFYILPMKLPNRCVTQQLCTLPPNPFRNQLTALAPELAIF